LAIIILDSLGESSLARACRRAPELSRNPESPPLSVMIRGLVVFPPVIPADTLNAGKASASVERFVNILELLTRLDLEK